MKIVILQPSYLPWIGYFNLIKQADFFVFYDDVQFTIRDWRTRNRIKTPNGWIWLSVPVSLEKPYFEYKINEVKISYIQNWQKKHLKSIKFSYKTTPYFKEVFDIIEYHINRGYKFLVDLDINLILDLAKYIGLEEDTNFILASEFKIEKKFKKTDRLLKVIENLERRFNIKVDEYISGKSAKDYLEEEKFLREGIKVKWHDYSHPVYNQITFKTNKDFLPYMSIIDLLFVEDKSIIKKII